MKTKYAGLIKQLEEATYLYESALEAARKMERSISGMSDVLQISGGLSLHGERFEGRRAIQLSSRAFLNVALDCGSGFGFLEIGNYYRFECTVFGCRVFALIDRHSTDSDILKKNVSENE